jgi:hypothetical protein
MQVYLVTVLFVYLFVYNKTTPFSNLVYVTSDERVIGEL